MPRGSASARIIASVVSDDTHIFLSMKPRNYDIGLVHDMIDKIIGCQAKAAQPQQPACSFSATTNNFVPAQTHQLTFVQPIETKKLSK